MEDAGALGLDPDASISTVAMMYSALKSACTTKRFFRSIGQWLAAFNRYKIAAYASGHLTYTEAEVYIATILQASEDLRNRGESCFLVFVYDELCRRSLHQRVRAKDRT